MTSIARRPTPVQARIMRIVSGAVRQAMDHHPNWSFDRRMVTSIAKRAAGTLAADTSLVFAAEGRKQAGCGGPGTHARVADGNSFNSIREAHRDRAWDCGAHRAGRSTVNRPALHSVHVELGKMIREARHLGNVERASALIDAARMVSLKEQGEQG